VDSFDGLKAVSYRWGNCIPKGSQMTFLRLQTRPAAALEHRLKYSGIQC